MAPKYPYARLLRGQPEDIGADTYWRDRRVFYDADRNAIYKCFTRDAINADESADIWFVWKFTVDANNDTTRIQGPAFGSCDNRATLGW
jgi:hypothetical protein